MDSPRVRFALGFNFDWKLIVGIREANAQYAGRGVIDEVFGALTDCPISSARPTARIPVVDWGEFDRQVASLRKAGVSFNFLMNTAQPVDSALEGQIRVYLHRLLEIGVDRVTVGTPTLCAVVKAIVPSCHVTLSITYGIRSASKLWRARASGADAVYLDGTYVNRDFALLRALIAIASVECRLYANMSCLSRCPVVGRHYSLFAGAQDPLTVRRNDAYFAGCSFVKLLNPTEWLQMPWIRPEDVLAYYQEGIQHFKLADRLAPTQTLLNIARSYLSRRSPQNLFGLMERNSSKYRLLLGEQAGVGTEDSGPIYVHNERIPDNFIDHFRQDGCKSCDVSCETCIAVAQRAVEIRNCWSGDQAAVVRSIMPLRLRNRLSTVR